MLERILQTRQILDDPKNTNVKTTLAAAVEKQRVLLARLIRDTGERKSISRVHFFCREVFIRETNKLKDGEAPEKLLFPVPIGTDIISFAREIGEAWEKLTEEEIRQHDKKEFFSPPLQKQKSGQDRHHPVSPINAFSVSKNGHIDNYFGRVATNLGGAIVMAREIATECAILETLYLATNGKLDPETALKILQNLDARIQGFRTEINDQTRREVVVCEYKLLNGKRLYPDLVERLKIARADERSRLLAIGSFLSVGFSEQI